MFTSLGSGNNSGTTGGGTIRLQFDASKLSSVYSGNGTNTKIQESATQMYLYFYVGEFSKSATEQTAGLNSELLNQKIDISSLAILVF